MVSVLLVALAVTGPSTVVPARPDDPPIRISLNSDAYYARGDRAKVRLRVAQDGYVVVLRADVDGRVRVLFPLDPGDDDFVRGRREFEVRGRGDRETFFVDDAAGTGTVLAARSAEPFHYDRFVRGDHWDYRVLVSDRVRDDPEAGLLDLIDQMADSAHFDYDVVRYNVAGDDRPAYSGSYYAPPGPCFGCGWYGSGSGWYGYGSGVSIGIGFTFGSPYPYRYPYYYPYYDPFYYDPFFYSYYYPSYYPYYRYPYYRYPYYRPYGYGRPVYPGGGFVFKGSTPPPPLVLPRQRMGGTTAGMTPRRPVITGFEGRGRRAPPDVRRPLTTPRPPAQPNVGERRREAARDMSRERPGWTAQRPDRVPVRRAPQPSAGERRRETTRDMSLDRRGWTYQRPNRELPRGGWNMRPSAPLRPSSSWGMRPPSSWGARPPSFGGARPSNPMRRH